MNAIRNGIAALALVAAAPLALAGTTSFNFTCFTNNTGDCSSLGAQLQMNVTELAGNKVEFAFTNLNPDEGSITQIYFDTNLGTDVRLANPTILTQPATGSFSIGSPTGFPPGSNGNPINWGGTTDFRFDSANVNAGVQSGESLILGFDLLVSYASLINSFTYPPLGASRIGLHLQSVGPGGENSEGMYATVVPVPAALPLMLTGLVGLGLMARRRVGR